MHDSTTVQLTDIPASRKVLAYFTSVLDVVRAPTVMRDIVYWVAIVKYDGGHTDLPPEESYHLNNRAIRLSSASPDS